MAKSINAVSIVVGNLHLMIIKERLAVSAAWDKVQAARYPLHLESTGKHSQTCKLQRIVLEGAREEYRESLARLSGLYQMQREANDCGYTVEQQLPLQLVEQGG